MGIQLRSVHFRTLLTAAGFVLILLGLLWPTIWLLSKTSDEDGAGIANVLALPVAGLSLVVGVVAVAITLRDPKQLDDPAVLAPVARRLLAGGDQE